MCSGSDSMNVHSAWQHQPWLLFNDPACIVLQAMDLSLRKKTPKQTKRCLYFLPVSLPHTSSFSFPSHIGKFPKLWSQVQQLLWLTLLKALWLRGWTRSDLTCSSSSCATCFLGNLDQGIYTCLCARKTIFRLLQKTEKMQSWMNLRQVRKTDETVFPFEHNFNIIFTVLLLMSFQKHGTFFFFCTS